MIVIIDYGMGNLRSVENSLKKLGIKYKISGEKKDIYEVLVSEGFNVSYKLAKKKTYNTY